MTPPHRTAEHLERDLDATARAIAPTAPPAGLWTRGRRRRRTRQVAAGAGVAAAVIALVLPAALVAGADLGGGDGSDVAARPDDSTLAIPDRLYRLSGDVPSERVPGPLAAVYESFIDGGPRTRVAGVSARDGSTVILDGVPVSSRSIAGFGDNPRYALSPDGALLAYAAGPAFGRGVEPRDVLLVRDLRTGEEVRSELAPRLVRRISGLRPMNFSGGVLIVSIDHAPGQSLHAVDPRTGGVTTLVPRGEALTFPGATSEEPVFTVGRGRVYAGAEPAEGRAAVIRGPKGFTLGPVAVSPDGTRLASVSTELYDGTEPEAPTLQVSRLQGSTSIRRADRILDLPHGGEVEAWLPDGRVVVQEVQAPAVREDPEISRTRWIVIDPDDPERSSVRSLDESQIDGSTAVIASGLLSRPMAPGIDPDPFSLADYADEALTVVLGAEVVAAAVILLRRRRRAQR